MADYKELLRRAVQALPENNGQARRAVYEKARAALVGQLRAITPPLAARDITTHRLQLEDCIRQVEQEASEAVIAGMQEPTPSPAKVPTTQPPKLETRAAGKPQPAPSEPPPSLGSIEEIIAASEIMAPEPQPVSAKAVPASKVAARPELKPAGKPELRLQAKSDAKSHDGKDEEKDDKPASKPNGRAARPLPSIVARAEAGKGKSPGAFGVPSEKPYDAGRRAPTIEPRRESAPRLEPGMRGQVAARQQMAEPLAYIEEPVVAAAMSAVREVEVEIQPEGEVHAGDPQGAIDRAIATLDREARAEARPAAAANGNVVEMPRAEPVVEPEPEPEPEPDVVAEAPATISGKRGVANGSFRDQAIRAERPVRNERPDRKARKAKPRREARGRRDGPVAAEAVFQRAADDRGGVSALTIFLGVFAVLLVGAAAGGFWAWREGYINLDSMFARSVPTVEQAVAPAQPAEVVADVPPTASAAASAVTGPGNTATAEPALAAAAPKLEERLTPVAPALAAEPSAIEPLALAATEPPKTEERLPVDGQAPAASETAANAVASIDPASVAGTQSLLLEASDNGTTGAVPFSGTVDWSRGTDETGASTLVAKASIPARNLTVDVLIRKNSDPSLPASHLMEINFSVSDSFIGGSVAGLPGVLLKNEELVQGAPLVGASARVVGNSFLFALSASPQDSAANNELLTTRKWIDLAIIYATGKRAIITLEKDEAADKMFRDVFAEWSKTASTGQ